MSLDPERDIKSGNSDVKGYPSLAAFIASDDDHGAAVYKRFDKLSARNILYLQSELAELETRQDQYDRDDLFDDDLATKKIARDWKAFKDAANITGSKAEQRMKLAMEIRDKVKEYREAIILDSAIFAIPKPSRQTYNAFHNHFMNVVTEREGYPTLGGCSGTIYNDREDLIAIARAREEDRLTRFLRNKCGLLFFTKKASSGSSLVYISASRISVVVGLVNVLLAAVFLFGAIYNLYYVEKDHTKLGLIAGYTIAFALCVSLITNARRPEIFGACAAYAAVLVVFISGNLGGNITTCAAAQPGVT